MADLLRFNWLQGGSGTTYAMIRRRSDGRYWSGSTFEVFTATRDTWDIPLSRVGSTSLYTAAYPTGLARGYYDIEYMHQPGGSPSDANDTPLGTDGGWWDGINLLAQEPELTLASDVVVGTSSQTDFDVSTDFLLTNSLVGAMAIFFDASQNYIPSVRRIVSHESTNFQINAVPDFTVVIGDPVRIVAMPRQLQTIMAKTDYLPSAAAGAAGGVFIAGSNAATTVNITGSLSGSVGSISGVTFPANFSALAISDGKVLLQEGSITDAVFAVTTAEWDDIYEGSQHQAELADLAGSVADVAPVVVPVSQEPIPPSRTWVLKQTDDGLRGEFPITRYVGDQLPFAVDYRNDLSNNGRLYDVAAPSVISGTVGGVVISSASVDRGVDRSLVKFKAQLVTAGTYEIQVDAVVDLAGSVSRGVVTLVVEAP